MGMSKRETLILNIDIAIEKQAKEIIENVMAKFLADAHAELFKQFEWHFIVKPKVQKAIDIALAKTVDNVLNGDILRERIK